MSNKYTKEFKEEAAKLVIEHGYSQAEAGRRLGISDKYITCALSIWMFAASRTKNN